MATIEQPEARPPADSSLLDPEGHSWLENGERMDRWSFLRRYEQTPEGFRAELVGGIVYVMASPLKNRHGRSGHNLSGCLFVYVAATPGTEAQDNTTTVLGEESVPQPDSALLILPECGGQTREGEDDYTYGAPELIVEVAGSSRSMDLHAKLRDYERAGALEYLVYEIHRRTVHWFERREGKLVPLGAGPDGLFRSRAFPGLWIDPDALARGDKAALLATLNRGLASPEHAAFVAELARRREARVGPDRGGVG